ncbi:MAG: hypothetical protein II477_02470 [Lachnospiraceae bacterium]|nr:hypothetical protein [Lachnospiraceae bacterium]MBQ2099920.1 hypothetical protein [Lachnospiraceae bacterium]MBQ3905795.1 hypothetical protein [Lachnospiraceae bacterium]
MNDKEHKENKNKWTAKRIAAILGIILLLGLYVVTLIVAIVDRSASGEWFMICLIATVTVPLLIWIYTWMYGMLTNKHTIASFELEKKDQGEDKEE